MAGMNFQTRSNVTVQESKKSFYGEPHPCASGQKPYEGESILIYWYIGESVFCLLSMCKSNGNEGNMQCCIDVLTGTWYNGQTFTDI